MTRDDRVIAGIAVSGLAVTIGWACLLHVPRPWAVHLYQQFVLLPLWLILGAIAVYGVVAGRAWWGGLRAALVAALLIALVAGSLGGIRAALSSGSAAAALLIWTQAWAHATAALAFSDRLWARWILWIVSSGIPLAVLAVLVAPFMYGIGVWSEMSPAGRIALPLGALAGVLHAFFLNRLHQRARHRARAVLRSVSEDVIATDTTPAPADTGSRP